MPEVWIPPRIQGLTDGRDRVKIDGSTVREVVNNLEKEFPGIKGELCRGDGINPGLAVVIDGETANLGMLERVGENSEIHFIPAIAGGSSWH